jgi:hypothetical protein
MRTINLHSHVGSDGVLHLDVPVGLADTDLQVVLIVHPSTAPPDNWQPGFFEEVIGSWEGEPLTRPVQLPMEIREEIR